MSSIYGKLCTILYDLDKPFASADEYSMYTDTVKSKDAKILEPMCGSGRFLIPLLKEGYDISGFDLSGEMIKACREKCARDNLKAHVTVDDITSFQSSKKYDYVFIPMGSVSLILTQSDLIAAFRNIYSCLDESGTFIFSFLDETRKSEPVNDWKETQRYNWNDMEISCKQKVKIIEESSIMDITLLYELMNGDEVVEREYQDFPIKLHAKQDIVSCLSETGFNDISEISSDTYRGPFTVLSCVKV